MTRKNTKKPVLALPKAEIADRGMVRIGGGVITGKLPELRLPPKAVRGRGAVRIGGGVIAGDLPL